MKASLLDTDAPMWTDVLGRVRHDFYHLPGYVDVSARQDQGEPCALLVEESERQLLLPLVIRPVTAGLVDAISPYGYPGTLVAGTDDTAFERDALIAGTKLLGDEGVVSLFIRLHPLLNREPPAEVGTLVRHGDTVCVDLTVPAETQWSQTRRNHRQQIRQALEAGFEASIDEDWRYYERFKTLYRDTMMLRSADEYYFFDDAYFDNLRAALGERIRLAAVTVDGRAIATAMFVETESIVQMHLTGHDEAFSSHQPMKLLFHEIRSWASVRGNRWLHLGGGRGGVEDSLFHFKAGFSRLRSSYHTMRVVTRPDDYARLVSERDASLDPEDTRGQFPLYRAPDR